MTFRESETALLHQVARAVHQPQGEPAHLIRAGRDAADERVHALAG
ncbi:MAG: hypothetical protein ACJ75M_18795 [Actinomycetes bacterium]